MSSKPLKECRAIKTSIEIRAKDDGKKALCGYASVFYDGTDGTAYDYWDIRETVAPNAFDRAIKDKQDVRALFNHDPSGILGRISAKTLRLSVDQRGLFYEIDLPNTQLGKDVEELVSRGDIDGSSFGFRVKAESYIKNDDKSKNYTYIRQINDVDLVDVSPVTFPAYEGTSANLRSEDAENIRAEAEKFLQDQAEAKKSQSEESKRTESEQAEIEILKLKARALKVKQGD